VDNISKTPGSIRVSYLLSEKGRRAALAAGVNAGREQHIIAVPEGEEGQVALREAVRALQAVALGLEGTEDSDQALAKITRLATMLGFLLDPRTAINTRSEVLPPECWEALAKAASINQNSGLAFLGVGARMNLRGQLLTNNKARLVGYEAQMPGESPFVGEVYGHAKEFDWFQDIASLLEWRSEERARLEALEEVETAKLEPLRKRAEAAGIAARRQRNLSDIRYFFEANKYKNEPWFSEVEAVQLLLQRMEDIEASSPEDPTRLWANTGIRDTDVLHGKKDIMRGVNQAVEAKAQEVLMREMRTFARSQGSTYLRTLLEEGMGQKGLEVYRTEVKQYRIGCLQSAHPNWIFAEVQTSHKATAPSEEDVNLLLAAREEFPDAQLCQHGLGIRESCFVSIQREGLTFQYSPKGADSGEA